MQGDADRRQLTKHHLTWSPTASSPFLRLTMVPTSQSRARYLQPIDNSGRSFGEAGRQESTIRADEWIS